MLSPWIHAVAQTNAMGRVLESRKELTSLNFNSVHEAVDGAYFVFGAGMILVSIWRSRSSLRTDNARSFETLET